MLHQYFFPWFFNHYFHKLIISLIWFFKFFAQFFHDEFEVKYLQIVIFSEKYVSFKLNVIFSTNFRHKTKKIVRAVFEKNVNVSDFGLTWRPSREYLQTKDVFQKSGSIYFLLTNSVKIYS